MPSESLGADDLDLLDRLGAGDIDLPQPGPAAPRGGGGPLGAVVPFTPPEALTQETGISPEQYDTFRGYLAHRESSGYGEPANKGGYMGRYQMGPSEIRESAARLGIAAPSAQDFLANPDLQEQLFADYTLDHHHQLMKNPAYADGDPVTRMALLAGAHLGGPGGVTAWQKGQDRADANGTRVSSYINGMFGAAGGGPGSPLMLAAAAGPGGGARNPLSDDELGQLDQLGTGSALLGPRSGMTAPSPEAVLQAGPGGSQVTSTPEALGIPKGAQPVDMVQIMQRLRKAAVTGLPDPGAQSILDAYQRGYGTYVVNGQPQQHVIPGGIEDPKRQAYQNDLNEAVRSRYDLVPAVVTDPASGAQVRVTMPRDHYLKYWAKSPYAYLEGGQPPSGAQPGGPTAQPGGPPPAQPGGPTAQPGGPTAQPGGPTAQPIPPAPAGGAALSPATIQTLKEAGLSDDQIARIQGAPSAPGGAAPGPAPVPVAPPVSATAPPAVAKPGEPLVTQPPSGAAVIAAPAGAPARPGLTGEVVLPPGSGEDVTEQIARDNKSLDQMNAEASNAQNQLGLIRGVQDNLKNVVTGPSSVTRNFIAKNVLQPLGIPADQIAKWTGTDPNAAAYLDKSLLQLVTQQMGNIPQGGYGVMQEIERVFPSRTETPVAAIQMLLNSMRLAAQRSLDLRDQAVGYHNQAAGNYRASGGRTPYSSLDTFRSTFDRENPATDYYRAAQAMTPDFSKEAWSPGTYNPNNPADLTDAGHKFFRFIPPDAEFYSSSGKKISPQARR